MDPDDAAQAIVNIPSQKIAPILREMHPENIDELTSRLPASTNKEIVKEMSPTHMKTITDTFAEENEPYRNASSNSSGKILMYVVIAVCAAGTLYLFRNNIIVCIIIVLGALICFVVYNVRKTASSFQDKLIDSGVNAVMQKIG